MEMCQDANGMWVWTKYAKKKGECREIGWEEKEKRNCKNGEWTQFDGEWEEKNGKWLFMEGDYYCKEKSQNE